MATKEKLTKENIENYEIVQFNNKLYALKKKEIKGEYYFRDIYLSKKDLKKGKLNEWGIFFEDYCTFYSIREIKRAIKIGLNVNKEKNEKAEKKKFDWSIKKNVNVALTEKSEIKKLKKEKVKLKKEKFELEKVIQKLKESTNISVVQKKKLKLNFLKPLNFLFGDRFWMLEEQLEEELETLKEEK